MNVSLAMLKTGDLNPHWLGYPHLAFYFNTIAFFLYFLVGHVAGVFATPADIPYPEVITIGVGKLAMPSEFLVGRSLTALMSIGAVILVYLIGRQFSDRKSVSLLATLLFAVSPAAVANSKFISLDAYGVFFLLLALYWVVRATDDPTPRRYFLAGMGIALAFSGKYNVGVIIVALFVAHWLNFGIVGWRRKEIYLALLASGLAFAVVNPFSALDPGGFFYGLTLASGSQSQFTGTSTNTFSWYISYLWNVEGIVVVLATFQAIRILLSRSKHGLVLISFPIVYIAFVSLFSVRNDRTILPVIPFLDLLAALLVADLCVWLVHAVTFPRRVVQAGAIALSLLLILPPLKTSVAADSRLTQIDSRETARQWIDANLPQGSRVAVEGYSPYVDSHKFVVQGVDTIIKHPSAWYVQNGFEYLVLSQGIYGQLLSNPRGFPLEVDRYNHFFSLFTELKRFNDNGYEIRIYKTGVTLPSHRVAARYGDYGEHVELVGYDDVQWTRGDPLRVRLTWGTLDAQPEPYEVELRLLAQDDREIVKTRGDLFQGKGWQTGMFDGTWVMPVPPETKPGQYRLQVNVIWMRYAYPMPAQSWTGQKIDPVILEPIEMQAR